ncbi:uncharacterized protein BT62DRAFT_1077709 [Guyanagaster necrorhizus]|uniref:Uncharacterized protein n=1 Tax=Guyanagaster necrorhizus TaxID=856835 RepID=A0A9P8ARZ9_9AGAR|nr:uncharacterized protein BT62DRAFT_1077709 [Guyanagaster necrorhizus MCA 3950]KAG7444367.1 hypothetical protein BT62DRAFT_1077709 [Guyanagaster necrorhizus MCA 3950]
MPIISSSSSSYVVALAIRDLPREIYAILNSRGNGRSHWTFSLCLTPTKMMKIHATAPSPDQQWLLEAVEHDITGRDFVDCTMPVPSDNIIDLLCTVPLEMPAIDVDIEPKFSCRVWRKQAVHMLSGAGLLRCNDVYALEAEIVGYTEANDENVRRGEQVFL